MTLRARLAVLAAVAVAVAVVLVSVVAYRASRDQQVAALDSALRERADQTAERVAVVFDLDAQFRAIGRVFEPEDPLQVVDEDGTTVRTRFTAPLPVDPVDRAVAAGADPVLRDVDVDGERLRMITVPVPDVPERPFGPPRPTTTDALPGTGRALQLAESRAALDESLDGLGRSLTVVALLGVAGAALAGMVVARRALRPVGRLTAAAEHVADTQDLDATIAVEREDELGRLAVAFNEMLAALAESRRQQQQLVTDASHELRTPLTSLRTNVELLQRADGLPDDERGRIVDDAVGELEELSALVAELVDLATDRSRAVDAWEDVALDAVAERVARRWRRRRDGPITIDADGSVVRGNPALLERALANLIDNGAKWSPDDAPIEVTVTTGRVAVHDIGPGIPEEERTRVFDRFYRSPGGQDRAGSGLGLAIVAQIIDAHGGEVFIEDPDRGAGVVVGFRLPLATA